MENKKLLIINLFTFFMFVLVVIFGRQYIKETAAVEQPLQSANMIAHDEEQEKKNKQKRKSFQEKPGIPAIALDKEDAIVFPLEESLPIEEGEEDVLDEGEDFGYERERESHSFEEYSSVQSRETKRENKDSLEESEDKNKPSSKTKKEEDQTKDSPEEPIHEDASDDQDQEKEEERDIDEEEEEGEDEEDQGENNDFENDDSH